VQAYVLLLLLLL